VKCTYCTYKHVIELSSFSTIHKLSVNPGFASRSCLSYLSCASRQLSQLNGRKLNHLQVYGSSIFYVWLRLGLRCVRVYSRDFVCLLVACTILF
jgi:hypothetical protein